MNEYQFNKISRDFAKTFGKISKGHENDFINLLMPLETNVMKVHRLNNDSDSFRMIEAINIVLHRINGYFLKKNIDTSEFETEKNMRLAHALSYTFDPLYNDLIMKEIKESASFNFDKDDLESLKAYYKIPIRCLLRIAKSVEFGLKNFGSDGYFSFLERTISPLADKGSELEYRVNPYYYF